MVERKSTSTPNPLAYTLENSSEGSGIGLSWKYWKDWKKKSPSAVWKNSIMYLYKLQKIRVRKLQIGTRTAKQFQNYNRSHASYLGLSNGFINLFSYILLHILQRDKKFYSVLFNHYIQISNFIMNSEYTSRKTMPIRNIPKHQVWWWWRKGEIQKLHLNPIMEIFTPNQNQNIESPNHANSSTKSSVINYL